MGLKGHPLAYFSSSGGCQSQLARAAATHLPVLSQFCTLFSFMGSMNRVPPGSPNVSLTPPDMLTRKHITVDSNSFQSLAYIITGSYGYSCCYCSVSHTCKWTDLSVILKYVGKGQGIRQTPSVL